MEHTKKKAPENGVRCFSGGGSDCGLVAWQRPDQELCLRGNDRMKLILEEEIKVIKLVVVVVQL